MSKEILIREDKFGNETKWYSQEIMERQCNIAYQVGVVDGSKVDFVTIEPLDENQVRTTTREFKKLVGDKYLERLDIDLKRISNLK